MAIPWIIGGLAVAAFSIVASDSEEEKEEKRKQERREAQRRNSEEIAMKKKEADLQKKFSALENSVALIQERFGFSELEAVRLLKYGIQDEFLLPFIISRVESNQKDLDGLKQAIDYLEEMEDEL